MPSKWHFVAIRSNKMKGNRRILFTRSLLRPTVNKVKFIVVFAMPLSRLSLRTSPDEILNLLYK